MNEDGAENRNLGGTPEPPAYLFEVRDLLRKNQREIWEWFCSDKQTQVTRESVKLDLLKSTVRLEPADNKDLYGLAESAATTLGLEVPVTIYQAKQSGQFNASISCDVEHAHLVLQGDLQEHLDPAELSAVFGHELSHLLLWRLEEGDFLSSVNMLIALAEEPTGQPIYAETLRLFSQYSEIFCDRGAMIASGALDPVVSSLIKIVTGAKSVKVNDYLKQANEIFSKDSGKGSQEVTHPELFIRARALDLWQKDAAGSEQAIQQMVQGKLSLDRMDFCRQGKARKLTRELLDAVLSPDWMRCEATLSHAQLYFEDYKPGRWNRKQMKKELAGVEQDFMDYIGYLMLDFVTADRDLLEPALAHTIGLAEEFGIKEAYIESARKELRLRKKQVQQIEKSADELADQASTNQQARQDASEVVAEPGEEA